MSVYALSWYIIYFSDVSNILSSINKQCVTADFTALELEEYAAAHDIHLQLMTDHVSEVSQWMVGIKKMIQAGNSS